jgi:GcrA cell cycle regulator
MSEGWSEERIALLKAMVADNATAQEIADRFGDVSRSAVLGKCFRLGLQLSTPQGVSRPDVVDRLRRRAPAKPRAPKPKAARPPAVKPAPAPRPVLVEPEIDPTPKAWPKPVGPEAVMLAELNPLTQCRMPLWAPHERGGLYCGKPVRAEGQSWCAACAKLVYERRPIRERELLEMQQARLVKQTRSGAFA